MGKKEEHLLLSLYRLNRHDVSKVAAPETAIDFLPQYCYYYYCYCCSVLPYCCCCCYCCCDDAIVTIVRVAEGFENYDD